MAEEKKAEEKKAPEKKAAAAKPATEAKPEEAKKRKLIKGRHHSAIKRHRQSLKRATRNQSVHSAVKTAMKKVHQAVVSKNANLAQSSLRTAMSLLHHAASQGIIHHRNASRHVARLSSLVAGLSRAA